MIGHIAARELRSLFLSPLAWAILAVVLFILAFLFLSQLDLYMSYQAQLAMMESAPGVTESVVAPLFSSATIVLLLVVPLVTMRLISEERRNRT
jgi:ABC-2 type transport system permease protein